MDEKLAFYLQKGLVLCIFIFYFLLIVEYFVAFFVCKRKLHKSVRFDPEREKGVHLPTGVSIIKPLMGTDAFLEENLESHFTLNYGYFELLFCFHDDEDPAISVVKSIMSRYPTVDCRIIIGRKHYDVVNPLVRNILPAYEEAKYDKVWISTARIKVSTEILHDFLIQSQDEDVAMVHQLPYVLSSSTIPRTLSQSFVMYVEKIYFGACVAKHFLVAEVFNVPAFCGMSYLFKKSAVKQAGGFEALGKFLAEDYLLDKSLRAMGFKSILSAFPAQQNMITPNMASYKDRLVRWSRLRFQLVPMVTLVLEPISSAFAQAFLVSSALYTMFSIHPTIFIPLHLLLWFALDVLLLVNVEGKRLTVSLVLLFFCWLAREFLTYFILFEALLNPLVIRWGKSVYRLKCGARTAIK